MPVSALSGVTIKLFLFSSLTNFRIYLNPEVFYGLEKC